MQILSQLSLSQRSGRATNCRWAQIKLWEVQQQAGQPALSEVSDAATAFLADGMRRRWPPHIARAEKMFLGLEADARTASAQELVAPLDSTWTSATLSEDTILAVALSARGRQLIQNSESEERSISHLAVIHCLSARAGAPLDVSNLVGSHCLATALCLGAKALLKHSISN